MHHTHTATATTTRSFDDDGIADHLGNATDLRGVIWQFAFRTRHTRHACFDHRLLGRHLVAHDADGLGSGADKLKAALFYPLRKISVFA